MWGAGPAVSGLGGAGGGGPTDGCAAGALLLVLQPVRASSCDHLLYQYAMACSAPASCPCFELAVVQVLAISCAVHVQHKCTNMLAGLCEAATCLLQLVIVGPNPACEQGPCIAQVLHAAAPGARVQEAGHPGPGGARPAGGPPRGPAHGRLHRAHPRPGQRRAGVTLCRLLQGLSIVVLTGSIHVLSGGGAGATPYVSTPS